MKAESFSEHGWRRYDIKKETNMPLRHVKYMTERRQEGKAGLQKKCIVHFIRLDLKFCFLSHVLKELTVVVVVLKIV